MGARLVKARFPGDLHAPASARSFVAANLTKILGPRGTPHSDDVLLIVSELVTNSVRAGAGTIDVGLVAKRGRVEIEVTDDAEGWPVRKSASFEDLGGRGLAIVEKLADSWTATAGNPGKTVTATWFQ
jgi:anti-sigma regulatory factor (Ser/Thr protein kinase)